MILFIEILIPVLLVIIIGILIFYVELIKRKFNEKIDGLKKQLKECQECHHIELQKNIIKEF